LFGEKDLLPKADEFSRGLSVVQFTANRQGEPIMSAQPAYSINTNVKFDALELIDVKKLQQECQEPWFNQTLCAVNDCVVRLGVLKGEFHWHKHDREDEFFYVVEGKFLIDVGDRTVELGPQQGFTVPKGVMHRTRAPERTVILMMEGSGVIPTGD
jgi:mannose-6-phosphate isomerase-like protein (cupin superfamily)